MTIRVIVGLRAVAAAGAMLALAPTQTVAQGFLDQLFGGGVSQPTRPTFDYRPQQPLSPDITFVPMRPQHHKRVVVADVDPATQRQKTTDLWHDKTLRRGDAIMMKDGLHVYAGPEAAKHSARQFLPLDRAHLGSSRTKTALVAMDMSRRDPLPAKQGADTISTGRSAAVASAISQGYRITDARGASVRYVGP